MEHDIARETEIVTKAVEYTKSLKEVKLQEVSSRGKRLAGLGSALSTVGIDLWRVAGTLDLMRREAALPDRREMPDLSILPDARVFLPQGQTLKKGSRRNNA